MSASRVAVVTAVSLALLGACTPSPVGPSPSPTPSVASTPAETQLERQTRLDYAAAEKAYRTWNAEYNRVMQAGGSAKPTVVMKETLAGPYLREITDLVEGFRRNGGKQVGTRKIAKLEQGGYSDTELLLAVCEDGSDIQYYQNGKKALRGNKTTGTLTIRKTGGSWKIWSSKGEETSEC